jgi:hypothetical protein
MVALPPQENFTSDASGSPPSMTRKILTTEVRACFQGPRRRMELVNITVVKEDFEKLKALGGFNTDYMAMALTHYVHVLKNTTFPRDPASLGWRRGSVVSFPCGIPKDIADEVRNFPGRFDEHTIEAVRCLFREDVSGSGPVSVSPNPRLTSALSGGLLFATCAGLVFFASRILRFVNNLALVNR